MIADQLGEVLSGRLNDRVPGFGRPDATRARNKSGKDGILDWRGGKPTLVASLVTFVIPFHRTSLTSMYAQSSPCLRMVALK